MSFSSILFSQIVINEYSCSNTNTVTDAFNQYEDWVELYNIGGTAINLTGYYISDDPANPMKWQIPAVTPVNGGARKMVFCSDRGVVAANGEIHPTFKLTQARYTGEWFVLSDASGNLVDSVHLNLTQRGHSRGRTTDGAATFSIFTSPTPNSSNATATPFTAYATKPILSVAPGFYTTTQNVTLSSPDPNVTIRYTTDGSTPTTASTAYSAPISITLTTVLRARAFSSTPSIAESFTETNTYLINETTTMNVISVSGPFNTLFSWSSQPIFCSYEFFDMNKNFIEEFEGHAQKHGHDSWAYPQKGFKVYADDELGYKAKMEHKYFRSTLRDTFDMVILKAAGSDSWPGGPSKSAHIRDAFCHTLAEKYNLDMDFRRYEPTIVFVNGQYWGVYEIRERVDKDFFEYYYGKKESKVQNLRYWGGYVGGTPAAGINAWNNLASFINTNNMAVQANYDVVKDSLNITSFQQFFILNEYLVNHDWLNWNTQWWRAIGNNPIKWRYACWDQDAICGLDNANYTGVNTIGPTNDPCNTSTLFQNSTSIKHTQMLSSLMNSPEFVTKWKAEWINMLTGPLDCNNMIAHFDSLVNILTPEMQRQATRWSGNISDWNDNVDSMRAWINARCSYIVQGIDTCYDLNPQMLKLNVSPAGSGTISLDGTIMSPYVWQKVIEGDSIYTLKATPTGGQYWAFDHWEKQEPTNTMSPNMTTDQVQFDFKKKDSVIAYFKYFNYDSVDVTFDVTPPGTGTISLNGNTFSTYPTTLTLDRRYTYNLIATPNTSHKFIDWSKNNSNSTITPSVTEKEVVFGYQDKETVVAQFEFIPPPPPPPPLPTLTAVDKTVFIPNAFTPNGDGKNDAFNIRVSKDAIGMNMTIFDRWGKLLFEGSSITAGWDGTFKGRNVEVGAYQYIIKVKFRDNKTETFTGDVNLIR